ncbi:MAG: hypothetical protein LLF76_02750 [Planctomycetaceae bacterium]|nr:hypothetical protein [Planctomycetaceae bacterium]
MKNLKAYLHKWTRPADDFGFEGESQLQDVFDESALKLRYDIKKRICQVWFLNSKDCYLIYAIPAPFHITKAIHELKEREKRRAQLREEWLAQQEAMTRDERKNIRAIAEEVGNVYRNVALGRVSLHINRF